MKHQTRKNHGGLPPATFTVMLPLLYPFELLVVFHLDYFKHRTSDLIKDYIFRIDVSGSFRRNGYIICSCT
ncbi:MAG: hypothetical protein R2771_00730 [Saprospiraceae bacterium]